MSYEVLILLRAQKELADLPKNDFERMQHSLSELVSEPRPLGCKKLVGAMVGEFDWDTIELYIR